MMSFSNHNKSKEIAAVLCPYLRAKSPKTPFRVLAKDDDELFSSSYQALRLAGGRKGLFESRNHFVMVALLHDEDWFQVGRTIIELHCTAPNRGLWTGAGEFKTTSADTSIALAHLFDVGGKTVQKGVSQVFLTDV